MTMSIAPLGRLTKCAVEDIETESLGFIDCAKNCTSNDGEQGRLDVIFRALQGLWLDCFGQPAGVSGPKAGRPQTPPDEGNALILHPQSVSDLRLLFDLQGIAWRRAYGKR